MWRLVVLDVLGAPMLLCFYLAAWRKSDAAAGGFAVSVAVFVLVAVVFSIQYLASHLCWH